MFVAHWLFGAGIVWFSNIQSLQYCNLSLFRIFQDLFLLWKFNMIKLWLCRLFFCLFSHVMVSVLLVTPGRVSFKQYCTYLSLTCFTDTIQKIILSFESQREKWFLPVDSSFFFKLVSFLCTFCFIFFLSSHLLLHSLCFLCLRSS